MFLVTIDGISTSVCAPNIRLGGCGLATRGSDPFGKMLSKLLECGFPNERIRSIQHLARATFSTCGLVQCCLGDSPESGTQTFGTCRRSIACITSQSRAAARLS